MHRLFGRGGAGAGKKEKKPTPTLDDASKSVEARSDATDARIKKLDAELLKYKTQLAKMKPGPSKTMLQKRAIQVLNQKRMYEKQKDSLMTQQFNVDQTKFSLETVKDTHVMVDAMKSAGKELKTAYKGIDVDKIADLQDDMSDLMEQNNEIQEMMGQAYGVPEDLDESDLNDELQMLEDQIVEEDTAVTENSKEAEAVKETPAYLVTAASAVKQQKQPELVLDGASMPSVPTRKLQV